VLYYLLHKFLPKNSNKKNLVLYNTTNGIIVLRIHVYVDHYIIAKNLKSMWIFLWRKIGNVTIKEGLIYLEILFSIFFFAKEQENNLSRKMICIKNKIRRYWGFWLISTSHLPLQFVNNVWLKSFNMHKCAQELFFSLGNGFH
jgi:hypothetical protein